MVMFNKRFHLVRLIGLKDEIKSILRRYDNEMYLMEYNDLGKPLNIAPNGKQGIFCISPDGFYHTWFILDEDVRFEDENNKIYDIIEKAKNLYEKDNGKK